MIFLKCNRVDPDGNCVRKIMTPGVEENGRICHRISSENEAASLLLSMSEIVSDEIKNNSCLLDDLSTDENLILQSKRTTLVVPQGITQWDNSDGQFTWNRVRTVSMDASSVNSSPVHQVLNLSTNRHEKRSNRLLRKSKGRDAEKRARHLPKLPHLRATSDKSLPKGQKKKSVNSNIGRRKSLKKILRKKFSWKNYPGTISTPSMKYDCIDYLLYNLQNIPFRC